MRKLYMSKNNYKIFVRFVGLLFAIFALIGAADIAKMNNVMAVREKFPQLEKLLAVGEEDELIRIFVGFDLKAGYQPENQISPSAVENQKRAIQETQTSILSTLADANHKVVVRGEYDFIPYIALDVDQETLLALSEMPNVVSIEERHLNEISLNQSVPSINGDDMRTAGYTGEGYTVAILDTGIQANHPAFGSRVVSEACYSSSTSGTSLCPNGLTEQTGAGSASATTSACYDSYGDNICYHGTHVASIAAGIYPYYGVAPDANIIAIQVFFRYEHAVYGSIVYADDADIVKGLQRVYALRGTYNITSVNMSFGSGKYGSTCDSLSGAMVTAVANLKSAGIQVVAASGNEGYTDGISFPACLSNVISVGSTNDYDATPSSFSNVAGILDLFAPGDNITAAYPGDSYATLYGTSMAAPHVSGAFAVLKEKYPSISTADILTAFKSSGPMVTKSSVSRHRIDLVEADNYIAGNLLPALNGGAEITSNQPIVAIGRPHMGAEIMGYNGINSGANTLYLPMLFNNIWNYTSTFTVENTTGSTATYTLTFKDGGNGTTSCVMSGETLPGHGVRTYDVTKLGACDSGYLPDPWAGGAKIESDQPLVAIATPKVEGTDPVTYNAFTGGADTVYLPMLFRNVWGYTSAFYVQNLDSTQNATITIDFYDALGHFTCRYEDSSPIGPAVTRGYWVPSMNCNDGNSFPAEGWAGSAVIESGGGEEIVAIGRPHMGTEVAAYNGFTEGGTSNYLPMLFRNMWGYTSAVYIQNVSGGTITEPIEIVFYDAAGNYTCTYRDNEDLADKATRGYWIPNVNCNAGGSFPGDGWVGSATIHTSGAAIAVGRPHLSDGEVVAYGAFTGGATEAYVPMLFRKYNGNESALYIQNLGDSDATVTITYYDEESGYYCAMAQDISLLSTSGVWLAGLDTNVCDPVP